MTLSELALEPFTNVREYNGFLIQILTSTVVYSDYKCFKTSSEIIFRRCRQRLLFIFDLKIGKIGAILSDFNSFLKW